MTCKETRIAQLDELKKGISEGKYIVSRLSKTGSFLPVETFAFKTINQAFEKYNELSAYIPSGFLRIHAKFDISIYDYRRN